MEPIKFLTPLKLIARFYPIEESTIDNKVVGILMYFMPLIYIEDTKPIISPKIHHQNKLMLYSYYILVYNLSRISSRLSKFL